jgi:phospholipase/carboxylesterase
MKNTEIKSDIFQHKFIPGTSQGETFFLTVVLHGLGDSYQGYTWMPSELKIPEMNYLLINAPDDYFGGYSWYDFEGDQNTGVVRSRGLLLKLMKELEEQGVSLKNVFLFGFSQGCLMSMDLGLRIESQLAGICGVSGYLAMEEEYPDQLSSVIKSQHFLVTHGHSDPVIPLDPVKKQYARLNGFDLNLEFKTYQKVHTMLPEEISEISAWFRERMKQA